MVALREVGDFAAAATAATTGVTPPSPPPSPEGALFRGAQVATDLHVGADPAGLDGGMCRGYPPVQSRGGDSGSWCHPPVPPLRILYDAAVAEATTSAINDTDTFRGPCRWRWWRATGRAASACAAHLGQGPFVGDRPR